MTKKDLLRVAASLTAELRDWRAELPGGISVARRLTAESTTTRGHALRLASIRDPSLHLELWLDEFTGRQRYYAGFRSSDGGSVKFLAQRAAPLFGAAETRTENDVVWVGNSYSRFAGESLTNIFRKPVLEVYPASRAHFFGRYFESLPESRAEMVLIDAIASFFRSTLAVTRLARVTPFDPSSTRDARRRIRAQIVQRQGQGEFRQRLLRAYKKRCAVTGSSTRQVLEAVHITPYLGKETNPVTNGLLLRSDIHTLFDLGLVGVLPEDFRVVVAEKLRGSEYAKYAGKQILLPAHVPDRPSKKALQQHVRHFKLASSAPRRFGSI